MGKRITTNEIMDFLQEHMVTKEYLEGRLDHQLEGFVTKDDLAELKSDLYSLMDGYAKQFDDVQHELFSDRSRIDRLERHTGIMPA